MGPPRDIARLYLYGMVRMFEARMIADLDLIWWFLARLVRKAIIGHVVALIVVAAILSLTE